VVSQSGLANMFHGLMELMSYVCTSSHVLLLVLDLLKKHIFDSDLFNFEGWGNLDRFGVSSFG